MEATGLSLLTVILFLPLVGMTIILFIPGDQGRNIRYTALGFSLVTFALSLVMWASFDPNIAGLQMVQRWDWLPTFGISYYVGVDGVSLLLIVLTAFI
ncbi:MAG: NADH-quinone oxidoreductase subunit M, partial [Anaerolineae bacterium]|nr:NADH-quinone oxidoreductase subunit M [Anaerolineae bacterium]